MKQKLIRFSFWALLLYTAVSTTMVLAIQFGWGPKMVMPSLSAEVVSTNSRDSLSEIAFVQQFVREYFFWTQGKEEARAERLSSFLSQGMDPQAGLQLRIIKLLHL